MDNIVFTKFQPIALIGTNPQSISILQSLQESTKGILWLSNKYPNIENSQIYSGSLKEHLATIWQEYRSLVFCMPIGAVVRLISPLLKDKSTDPAVVVIDSEGKFVISLCSGHQGGADRLSDLISTILDATPVITSTSSVMNLPAIDLLGVPYGWGKGKGNWTEVMSIMASNKEKLDVIQEVGSTLWQKSLSTESPFNFKSDRESNLPCIWISEKEREIRSNVPQVQWHPRVLWLGIGCERNTPTDLIEKAIQDIFNKYGLAQQSIAGIGTIDIKADEVGIQEVCKNRNLPLKTFSADILKSIQVPTPSSIVDREVGTPSVAEASAMKSANSDSLLITKKIFKDNRGGVTIAIAKSDREYIDRTGKLYLVGIGPGNINQITSASLEAIKSADVVIGYSLYLDLIRSLFNCSQVIESFPITQEKERCSRAIELANWGLSVAMVSSGDCGIYGMAGLVLEQLKEKDWDGKIPQVEIFPGISALQSTASLVGTPLMHDFCAISLSDLLTPWDIIVKRLEAAARGDFVTVLYNPRSLKRTQQIIEARNIFLRYRLSDTPCSIVRSAYRKNEKITITTLGKMLDTEIDMLSTVIIGNSKTYNYCDWMITPRGYSIKH